MAGESYCWRVSVYMVAARLIAIAGDGVIAPRDKSRSWKRNMAEIAKLIRTYVDCYNLDDLEGMLACCEDSVVFETVSNPGGSILLKGKDELREILVATRQAFTSRKHDLVRLVVDGETAAAESIFSGVAAASLSSSVRMGDHVSIRGATFFEMGEDRLGRICDYS